MHIVSQEEMQALDRYTMDVIGLEGKVLMENAGQGIFRCLISKLKAQDQIAVIIGKGNNGGDGFVVARYLQNHNFATDVWLVEDQHLIKGDAAYHMNVFLNSGGKINGIISDSHHFKEHLSNYTVIVDAILGTGIKGCPRKAYLDVIHLINQAKARVVSIDLPSGVLANGEPFSHEAVYAKETLTLQYPKLCMYTQPAATFFGETDVIQIGIPKKAISHQGLKRRVWTKEDVKHTLPVRDPFSHKGTHGKGLLIAGSQDMPGAAILSATSALRSGIGLLWLSIADKAKQTVCSRLPEVLFESRESTDFSKYKGIAIGPGLGRSEDGEALLAQVLGEKDIPLVIDADGLYHLTNHLSTLKTHQAPVVLTPHPGEMATLTGKSIKEVENDRFGISETFAKEHGVYLVLKGRNTIITSPSGEQVVNVSGNPALAKGGSGDVLTGIIFAFLLQHENPLNAISNAVYVHGAAADQLVKTNHSLLDVLASDLSLTIPTVLHDLYLDTMC
ncbi:NAD(P)H-hydrate dehydratase [Terrilactibacillus sp. BCM23-1]|uniref:Bifunctional NAD(P)H-hydrate repair enzyme n=1 Tax=Terrilactibacillus tamarindi TaxID=2599694 RepID=A0A6N8CSL4_9BACI|nr:NAD(P)H-hydrate dehydratase [Terrilactibacillus tamarindi]MTT33144.1 NAD(P)H-hydrate dehydratase [Terrilactibacillus tamarindi]